MFQKRDIIVHKAEIACLGKIIEPCNSQAHYNMVSMNLLLPTRIAQRTSPMTQVQYNTRNTFQIHMNLSVFQHNRQQILKNIKQRAESEIPEEEKTVGGLSPYDQYVQTSLLKNIYKAYSNFTQLVGYKMQEKGEANYPIVNLLLKKNMIQGQEQDREMVSSAQENQFDTDIRMEKNIQIYGNEQNKSKDEQAKTVYANFDMENIMGRVYRDIEEKLRYERLKKGLS